VDRRESRGTDTDVDIVGERLTDDREHAFPWKFRDGAPSNPFGPVERSVVSDHIFRLA
jgi:hypothetical protein